MKTKKLRFIFLALALCFCSLAAAVGFSGVRANVASAADVSYEFSEVYPVGYMLDFSRGVKINVGKNEYDVTDVYVVFPDETAHSGDLVVLTMAGEYEVVFSCKVSGEFVSVRKKFRATGDLISFENGKSTVSYGEMNNNWADAYKNGLKLSLGESDTMIYGRPIDLYKNTITDIITMNVLQKDVVADVGQMVLRLTDVYDPSVYIEIIYKSDPAANVHFLRASANGGSSIGLTTGSAGEGVTVRAQIFYSGMEEELFPVEIPREKATFDDFKACVFLANTQFRGARYLCKSLQRTWYDEALSSVIRKLERYFVTSLVFFVGLVAILSLSLAEHMTALPALTLFFGWVLVDCLLISPLIFFAFVPKPVRKHIKDLDKLTPYEQKVRAREQGQNEQLEKLLKKYKNSGQYLGRED